jgi:hypothetical protein
MKIIKITASSLSPQEQQTINAACAQLRDSVPGIGPLLQNPNNLTFLMKFMEIISNNPSSLSALRNAIQTVKRAMDKDAASVSTIVGKI